MSQKKKIHASYSFTKNYELFLNDFHHLQIVSIINFTYSFNLLFIDNQKSMYIFLRYVILIIFLLSYLRKYFLSQIFNSSYPTPYIFPFPFLRVLLLMQCVTIICIKIMIRATQSNTYYYV